MEIKQAKRLQTSIINAAEKKALVWMAERMPRWVTSDMLSFVGFLGALIIGAGYALTSISPAFLWLSSFGFIVNWFGDSLDGTIARVRNQQRPIYGFYLDHTLDCINECIMFIGLGLSPLMNFKIALFLLIPYLLLTVNVSVNTHLKGEFKLTYFKLGPTEFRIIAIIINTLLAVWTTFREFSFSLTLSGHAYTFGSLDIAGVVVALLLFVIYFVSILEDLKYYAKVDPKKK